MPHPLPGVRGSPPGTHSMRRLAEKPAGPRFSVRSTVGKG
ncbi:hypothetical protein SSTG_03557 [Streptomyces sp. e14]|nr:hypothetical protein SSTG_03557 [Streptomyces sp. e14]